jgi:ribosomal protein L7/L12
MNYKTIQLALRELLYSHAEDGGSLVLADLNEYVESLTRKVSYLEDSLEAQRNLREDQEKQVAELIERIAVCETKVAQESSALEKAIEYTSLGTIVLTEEEKDKIKWRSTDNCGNGYWDKIQAIKSIRMRCDCGLIEAKDAVEYWLTEKNHLGHGKYYWANGEGRVELNMTTIKI